MKLRKIRIKNFKSIYSLEFSPKTLTVLIGRNNSGKTSILEAIQLLFKIIDVINEKIDLTQIIDHEIKEQIEVLPFFSNWGQPIEISALIELDSEEQKSEEVKNVIVKESGLEEEVRYIEVTVSIERENENITLKVKKLNILGYISPTTKELAKIAKTEKPTACKIIENYNVINTNALNAVKRLFKDKIMFIVPYLTYKSPRDLEISNVKTLAYIIRKPVISEELLEKIKEAKYNYKFRPKFYKYIREIEGGEASFERFTDREVLSKTYRYVSISYPLFGGGDQVIESILASTLIAKEGTIILIEEPETHQHPAYVKELARVLETIVKEYNIQIILTTHSPIFIKALKSKESIAIVRKEYTNTSMGRVPATQISEIEKSTVRHLDILVSELGIPASLPFFADIIILVEGGSDKLLIENFIEMLTKQNVIAYLPTVYYEIITFAQTPGKIAAWIELLKKLKVKVFVITDGDEEGEKYLKQAIQRGLEEGRYAFKLNKEDILCYVPGKIIAEILSEIIKEHFKNVQEELKEKDSGLSKLINKIKSSRVWPIGKLKGVSAIIFDSLSEDEKEQYNNDEKKFEKYLKTQIAKLVVDKDLLRNVPSDIKQILQIIDRNIIEG